MRQVWQERGRGRLGPAAIGRVAPLKAGVTAIGTRPALSYGGRATGILVWRQRAPWASFRQRVAGWRARNWRRVVLAWFVLSLIIVAVAAEPATDFPKAQTSSVPAVRMVMRVAGGLTVAGVPVLLIALP
jgi:hypothetical protein